MKFLEKLKQLFLGRVEPDFFRKNKLELHNTNYALLRRACLFSSGMCLFLFALTCVNDLIAELTGFYFGYTLFYTLLTVLVCTVVKRKQALIPVFYYTFAVSVFALVIDVGTRRTPELPAVTFYVFLMIIPLLFVTRPIYSVLLSITSCVIFSIVSIQVKGAETYLAQTDVLNAICCCIVGIGVDVTMGNLQLENIRAKAYFKDKSSTDELTGLPNRRRFDILLEKTFRQCIQEGESMAVFMLDIDDFKAYNDTYGHVRGDECLRVVSGALLRTARVHGVFLARYGGEEFVAVAVSRSPQELREIGQRLVESVEKQNLRHETTSRKRVTVSVGCAELCTTAASTGTALVACADLALYAAKTGGKNRSRLWSQELGWA